MEEAGETGSEAERRLWRMKRSRGSARNRTMDAVAASVTIEGAGVASGREAMRRLSQLE